MSKKEYTGWASYLTEHKITPEFVKDFDYWIWKIFYHWKLFMDFEEFKSNCWEALLSKLPEFDPEIATIQTFCLSRINNECWRAYMKIKQRKPEITCDDPVLQPQLIAAEPESEYFMFEDFVKYANSMGVCVNVDELYCDLKEEKKTPPVIAFVAWKLKNKELEGRDDFPKGRRQISR